MKRTRSIFLSGGAKMFDPPPLCELKNDNSLKYILGVFSYIKITITFDVLDRFQEVVQEAQTMNNILKSNAKWYLCYHGNREL